MEHKEPIFPDIVIEFEVWNMRGQIVHSGTFRLADHTERRAFAIRCNQAQVDGFEIRTRRSRNERKIMLAYRRKHK